MERSGVIPRSDVDLRGLDTLMSRPGRVLTVHLTAEAGIDNAAQRSLQRWGALRQQLAAEVPDQVLDAVEAVVPDAHHDGAGLQIVAADDGLRLRESHAEPPARDWGRWAPLPALAGTIEARQLELAHLMVRVDKQGADVLAVTSGGNELTTEVKGESYPIHKSPSGGWSQRRHQTRVEENWDRNAGQAAQEVERLARLADARVIVVAGDVRVRELLVPRLSPDLASLVVELDGTRGPDGSEDELADEVVRAVRTAAARATREILEKFKEQLGEGNRAVEGAPATVAAAAAAQIALLLVHDDPADQRTAWFGPEPVQLGLSRRDLEAMGVAEPVEARLSDVLIRAALGTGADVRVVPEHGGPSGRVGALLRWS